MNNQASYEFRHLIDGKLVASDRATEVLNPATWVRVGSAPRASVEQMAAAVDAAHGAFPLWAQTSADERSAILHRMADRIEANVTPLARLLTSEGGLPLRNSVPEIEELPTNLRYFADLHLEPEVLEDSDVRYAWLDHKPLGVIALITPWNFPIDVLSVKLPPALAAGNTVVVKPAGSAPLTTLMLAEMVADLLPAGVLNVVADDNDLGEALTSNPKVAKISFTGSTHTGSRVMKSASEGIRRVTLELGGNDPAIALADVDLDLMAEQVFNGAFRHSGQSCMAIKRFYVHSSIADTLCADLVRRCNEAVLGDGADDASTHGPLQNEAQHKRATEFLDEARTLGRILTEDAPTPAVGWWMRPTVVRDMPDDSRLVTDEQFCPILPVLTFDTDAELLERVNRTPYGLGASVWSKDVAYATSIARRIDSGMAWINKRGDIATHLPIMGAKQSGLGVELGPTGLKEFTQPQLINEPPRHDGDHA